MSVKICVLLGVLASVCVINTNATGSTYKSAYCQKPSMICRKGRPLGPTVQVPTINECRARCNRHRRCVTFHISKNENGVKMCTLKDQRCAAHELRSCISTDTDFYRLKKGENCPSNRPKFVRPPIKYSDDYCAMPHKRCLGHNMYAKPQNINVFTSVSKPYMACLHKCTRMRTCASVDFVNYKCVINDYHCLDGELDPAGRMDVNFMRLKPGESCPGNRLALGAEELDKIFPAGSPESQEPGSQEPESEEPESEEPESEEPESQEPESQEPESEEPESEEPESEEPESEEPESQEPESEEPESEEPESEEPVSSQRPETTHTCLCPCNSVRNRAGECKCKEGFEKVNNECILACPVGAVRRRNGSCRCRAGTDSIGRECLPTCPAGTWRKGRGCK